jgi:hypothetical protein
MECLRGFDVRQRKHAVEDAGIKASHRDVHFDEDIQRRHVEQHVPVNASSQDAAHGDSETTCACVADGASNQDAANRHPERHADHHQCQRAAQSGCVNSSASDTASLHSLQHVGCQGSAQSGSMNSSASDIAGARSGQDATDCLDSESRSDAPRGRRAWWVEKEDDSGRYAHTATCNYTMHVFTHTF